MRVDVCGDGRGRELIPGVAETKPSSTDSETCPVLPPTCPDGTDHLDVSGTLCTVVPVLESTRPCTCPSSDCLRSDRHVGPGPGQTEPGGTDGGFVVSTPVPRSSPL